MIIRRSVLWVGVNVGGVALFLYLGSRLWVQPGEEGSPWGPGDAFYWLFTLAPILFAFIVLNSAALIAIVRRARATHNKRPVLAWFGIALLWLAAVGYDHHGSFRFIDAQYGSLRVQRAA